MKNIVLYAPPAAGKGTQCELLCNHYGYKMLSIGELLREARKEDSEIGRIIAQTQDQGILTPDYIVKEILEKEIKKLKGERILVDGYPRNLNQAMMLDELLDNYIVINLEIDRLTAMKRSLGRVSCDKCHKSYNIYDPKLAPKEVGICDHCQTPLSSRSDDNEKSFNVRFDTYENNAKDILKYYDEKNILYKISSLNDTNDIFNEIENIIKGM